MIGDKSIQDFIDGNLSPEKSDQVRTEIETSEAVKERYLLLKKVSQALTDQSTYTAPAGFKDSVMANLHHSFSGAYGISVNQTSKRSMLIALAMVVLGVTAALLLLSTDTSILEGLGGILPDQVTFRNQTLSLKLPSTIPVSQDIFFKGLVYLNAFLGIFLLEKALIRPFFKHRSRQYSV